MDTKIIASYQVRVHLHGNENSEKPPTITEIEAIIKAAVEYERDLDGNENITVSAERMDRD